MPSLPTSFLKKTSDFLKSGCRFLCRPILPLLPDSVINKMPFLGRVTVIGPDQIRIKFHTYGTHGKDRIAIKLARRGMNAYEGETIQLFFALVKPATTIVDIGANTGLFALLAAITKRTSHVVAFEPVPFIFDMLQKNIRLNQLQNLKAIPMVVSNFKGTSKFYITHTSVGVPTDSSACLGFRDQVDEYNLTTISLDEYKNTHQLAKIDLLKIDVEAGEAAVIEGAFNTIEKDNPYIICEVLENVDHSYIQQTLKKLNYRFYHITPTCLEFYEILIGSLEANERNYLFVPAHKEEELFEICRKAGIQIKNK